MTIINILLMTAAELFGNTHLKYYAEGKNPINLTLGLVAWLIVLFFLVKCFSGQTMMWTCIMWEAAIVIGGAIVAYVFFGEKFNHWIQWLGILLALGAAICVNYTPDQLKSA